MSLGYHGDRHGAPSMPRRVRRSPKIPQTPPQQAMPQLRQTPSVPAPPSAAQQFRPATSMTAESARARLQKWREKRTAETAGMTPPQPQPIQSTSPSSQFSQVPAIPQPVQSVPQIPQPIQPTPPQSRVIAPVAPPPPPSDEKLKELEDSVDRLQKWQQETSLSIHGLKNGLEQLKVAQSAFDRNEIIRILTEKAEELVQQGLGTAPDPTEAVGDIIKDTYTEFEQKITESREAMRKSLKVVNDNAYFIYGTTIEETPIFETPSGSAEPIEKVPKDTRLRLVYPQTQTSDALWIKTHRIMDNGQIVVRHVPIYMIDRTTGDKTVYVSQFQT